MTCDILIVGAGIAGLSLARAPTAFGRTPAVLERSRGVGGRCATRRVDGQPVDHGPAFLHGRTPRFLAEMSVAGGVADMADWPQLREGTGVPCQPAAFDPHDPRRVPAAGVNALAKHLARDLGVRLGARVDALALTLAPDAPGARLWTVGLASGDRLLARTVALALPVPSVQALLTTIKPPDPAVVRLLPLLNLVHAVPCLTVIARYPLVAHFQDGPTLGIVGDGLHPSAGVEGAYLSGRALAERLVGPVPRA